MANEAKNESANKSIAVITSTSDAYETIRKAIGFRKSFDSVSEAYDAVKAIMSNESVPDNLAVIAAKVGAIDVVNDSPDLTEWPDEYADPATKVGVSLLGVRGLKGEDGKTVNGAGAIVLFPLYTLETIAESTGGLAFLYKILEKELALDAFRSIRGFHEGSDLAELAQASFDMPVSCADYIVSSGSGRMDFSVFTNNWPAVLGAMRDNPKFAALASAFPTQKMELVKCIRSKSYAESEYPDLEAIGKDGAFVFAGKFAVMVLNAMNEAASEAGEEDHGDPSTIESWLAGRDELSLSPPKRPDFDPSKVDESAFDDFLASADAG